jgi:4-amino-4-deoxy-L-arabinose transferase-like glycosyltransferase
MFLKNKLGFDLLSRHFLMPTSLLISSFILVATLAGLRFGHLSSVGSYTLLLTSGFLSFLFWFRELDNDGRVKHLAQEFTTGFFLVCLLLIIALNLGLLNDLDLPQGASLIFTFLALFGALASFYTNRERLFRDFEREENAEIETKRQRSADFQGKFARLSKIPIAGSMGRWIYQEGLFPVIGLVIITIIAVPIYFYGLGSYDMRDDELFVNKTAYNFLKEGNFYQWDWMRNISGKNTDCVIVEPYCNYTRAWPHTLTVALSYKLFGVSEFSTRLPGALFGLMGIIIIYVVSNFFIRNKIFALLISLMFALSPIMITWSRFARMYSLLIPIFSLTTYFVYKALTEKSLQEVQGYLSKRIRPWLDFNYKYIILSFIGLALCFTLHTGSLVILFFASLFVLFKLFTTHEKRYLSLLILIAVFGLIIISVFRPLFVNFVGQFFKFGEIGSRILYENLFFAYPFPTQLSLLFVIILGIFALMNLRSEISSKIIYLLIFVIGSWLVYTRFISTGLFADARYMSFLVPIVLTTISFSLLILIKNFNSKLIYGLLVTLTSVAAINAFANFSTAYYDFSWQPNLREAYSTILNSYQPGEAILSPHLRPYYLRELNATNIYVMPWRKELPFEEFHNQLVSADHGWLVWESDKVNWHIRPEIYNYAESHFVKYHGSDVDDTGVDVYYFNQNLID